MKHSSAQEKPLDSEISESRRHIDIVVLSIGSTTRIGLYENNKLFREYTSDELSLVALPKLFEGILSKAFQNLSCVDLGRPDLGRSDLGCLEGNSDVANQTKNPAKSKTTNISESTKIPESASSQNLDSQKFKLDSEKFHINAIYYANGPGSFSALKLTHIFLHTLKVIYGIRLYATSSFYFTNSAYIRAFGKTYFFRNKNGEITLAKEQDMQETKEVQEIKEGAFFLPEILDKSAFDTNTNPLYILPPV